MFFDAAFDFRRKWFCAIFFHFSSPDASSLLHASPGAFDFMLRWFHFISMEPRLSIDFSRCASLLIIIFISLTMCDDYFDAVNRFLSLIDEDKDTDFLHFHWWWLRGRLLIDAVGHYFHFVCGVSLDILPFHFFFWSYFRYFSFIFAETFSSPIFIFFHFDFSDLACIIFPIFAIDIITPDDGFFSRCCFLLSSIYEAFSLCAVFRADADYAIELSPASRSWFRLPADYFYFILLFFADDCRLFRFFSSLFFIWLFRRSAATILMFSMLIIFIFDFFDELSR